MNIRYQKWFGWPFICQLLVWNPNSFFCLAYKQQSDIDQMDKISFQTLSHTKKMAFEIYIDCASVSVDNNYHFFVCDSKVSEVIIMIIVVF